MARYAKSLRELLAWLHALVDGSPDRIANPDDPHHRRRALPPRQETPLVEVYVQPLLLLAALDPNIARLLSLGWVDRFRPHGDPHEGASYDYKVVGRWRDQELCGLSSVWGRAVGVPTLDSTTPVTPRQLPGVRWAGTEPLYRVGVRWRRPPSPVGPAQAVRPVAFDVWRRRLGTPDPAGTPAETWLTRDHPVIVPESAWSAGGPSHLIDPEGPRGTFWYQVAGIDLFGQTGPPVPQAAPTAPGGTITLADLEARWRIAPSAAATTGPRYGAVAFPYLAFWLGIAQASLALGRLDEGRTYAAKAKAAGVRLPENLTRILEERAP